MNFMLMSGSRTLKGGCLDQRVSTAIHIEPVHHIIIRDIGDLKLKLWNQFNVLDTQ